MANTGRGDFSGLRSSWFNDRRRRRRHSLLYKEFQSAVGSDTSSNVFNDYFFDSAPPPSGTGQIKVFNGSSFVAKPVKVWNGSAWVIKPLKRWNGSSWVTTNY